ncbi:MAG: hypothetical protein IPL18_11975 [Sphingomonadales bacterium]|nr:hypothetical protein [Sphingomonadales bacterium]
MLHALYNWYIDARYYNDVALGGTRNEALYALGPNPATVNLASGGTRLNYRTDREAAISVNLSDAGRITSLRCAVAAGTTGGCPAFRVAPGDTEGDMYGWLGVPNRTSVAGDVLTADYTGLGVRFELRQFKIGRSPIMLAATWLVIQAGLSATSPICPAASSS